MAKQYTTNDFDVIYSQISGCERVAGYLAGNLEKYHLQIYAKDWKTCGI